MKIYNSQIREIQHYLGYWVINQSYWYLDTKYTKEQAIKEFLSRINSRNGQ